MVNTVVINMVKGVSVSKDGRVSIRSVAAAGVTTGAVSKSPSRKTFQTVLEEAGLGPVMGSSSTDLCLTLREVLTSYGPDGICTNDTLGYTVLQVLETLLVRVPDDMAVIGYDETAGAECRKARLSTVDVDKHDLGAAEVRLFLEHLKGAASRPQGRGRDRARAGRHFVKTGHLVRDTS